MSKLSLDEIREFLICQDCDGYGEFYDRNGDIVKMCFNCFGMGTTFQYEGMYLSEIMNLFHAVFSAIEKKANADNAMVKDDI